MTVKMLEQAKVQAADTVVGEHEIEFYALAFSKMPDKQGDRIDPRALDGWLERFYAAGKALPISYHHAAMIGAGAADPFSVIGYAPADPDHVWVDEFGLRIRAILETEINDNAEQVYRLAKRGVLSGASAVFVSDVAAEKRQKDGSTLITLIPEVREAGPTLTPANTDAHVLSVKSEDEEEAAETVQVDVPVTDEMRTKAGRAISAANAKKLRAAQEVIAELLALVDGDGDEEAQPKSADPNEWVREKLAVYGG